jgi:glycopeptide antibiotics resistance protein
MAGFSSSGVRIRRERVALGAWLALALFIIIGSAGRWAPYEPGLWAPLLIRPRDIAVNVGLYVPFGVCGMLALRRTDARGVWRVTIIALLFSFAVESLQLYTADRVASLTDIVSACVGTLAGASAAAWWASPR